MKSASCFLKLFAMSVLETGRVPAFKRGTTHAEDSDLREDFFSVFSLSGWHKRA